MAAPKKLTEADRAVLAANLLRESEQRQQVRLGRWTPDKLTSGRVRGEDAEEGLAIIQRRAQEERTPENLRDLGIALGQCTEVGIVSPEASAARLVEFVRCTGTGELEQRRGPLQRGFLDGQASVRRARDRRGGGPDRPRGRTRNVPRPQPAARSLVGTWTLGELVTGKITADEAEAALARIVGGLTEHSNSSDLLRACRAAGQLGAVLDVERMRRALEAAGRRAGIPSSGVTVPRGLSIGLGELVDAERALA